MRQSVNLPLCAAACAEYGGWAGLREELNTLGCTGVEGIWAGEDVPADFPPGLLGGWHLTFHPDWLDFYREDRTALRRKFGSLEAAYAFYGGSTPDALLGSYRADLARARALGAAYVVFHVSDVSIEEGYTYAWLHSDEEVLDASAEIVNELLRDVPPTFDFLMENQWWPGLTFTDPAKTARLLERVDYPRAGLLLDTGHLMNTDTAIAGQADGARLILDMLARHGELAKAVKGVHLHQSVSGGYVRAHTGSLPAEPDADYVTRFCRSYAHIQRIDRHQPWTDPAVRQVVEAIAPDYLTHELSAPCRAARFRAVSVQQAALAGLDA